MILQASKFTILFCLVPYRPVVSDYGGAHPAPSILEHDRPTTPRAYVPGALGHAPAEDHPAIVREEDAGGPPVHPFPEERQTGRRSPSTRSIVHRIPPPRSAEPGDLSYDDAEQDRHDRFREIEGRLLHAAQTALDDEDRRETEFRRNEEQRNRLFLEHEERRDAEARQRGDHIPQDLGSQQPGPGSSQTPERQADAESLIGSMRDATSRYAQDILDTVKGEREELTRAREQAAEERERLRAEAEAERARVTEEREARIKALEDELKAVRDELENEKQLRVTEEAETRERERLEALERDEGVRNQLGDITNLVQDQRDLCARKKELMDERWAEKQNRRQDKDAKLSELFDMVSKIIQDREADRLRAEEDRAAAEARPGRLPFPLSVRILTTIQVLRWYSKRYRN
jgi:hypothetical protein